MSSPLRYLARASLVWALLTGAASFSPAAHAAVVRGIAELRDIPAGVQTRTDPVSPWADAQGSVPLRGGTLVRTDAIGVKLYFPNGTVISLAPSSSLRMQVGTEISMTPGKNTRVSHVDLVAGSMAITIPQNAMPMLVMAGKDVFAIFQPGRARTIKNPAGLVAVVDEGGARVASSGRWFTLTPHGYVVLPERGPVDPPKRVGPSPTFLTDTCVATTDRACAIATVVGEGSARLGARWQPAAPAVKYAIQLARDAAFTSLIEEQSLDGTQTSYMSPPLPTGQYWFGLRSITTDGVEGDVAVRPMRVVRLLPDAGVIHVPVGNVFVVPEGKGVRVGAAQGLTVSFGPGHSAPVPPVLALTGTRPSRIVFLRVDGITTDEVPIVVERRALAANVDFTPYNARWPKDTVQVTVRLEDPNHRLRSDYVRPTLRLRVNNTAAMVPLAKSGVAWTAAIPSRTGAGPWILRAEALDDDGLVLGRGMLEVVGNDDSGDR